MVACFSGLIASGSIDYIFCISCLGLDIFSMVKPTFSTLGVMILSDSINVGFTGRGWCTLLLKRFHVINCGFSFSSNVHCLVELQFVIFS